MAGCLQQLIAADQRTEPPRVGRSPHGTVELQLMQDGFTLSGTNSLGALQVILP